MASINTIYISTETRINPQCTNSTYCYTYRLIQNSTKALYRVHCLRQKLRQCASSTQSQYSLLIPTSVHGTRTAGLFRCIFHRVQSTGITLLDQCEKSRALLNDGDTFWEMGRYAISSLCERHRVYLHKPWNVALTWPPYVWKSFQASFSRRGRFQPYWRFVLLSNFPPQSAYLEFPKILTTVVYAVRRWTKRHYAAHYPSVLRGRTTGYQFRLAFTQKYFERISLQIVSLSVLWRCAFRDSPQTFWRSLKSSGFSGQRYDFGSRSMTLPALKLNTHTTDALRQV
jgi:hypothetical protein